MLKTSAANIETILKQNKCESLDVLNQKDYVNLELYHLSGYLNLSEFTQGAVKLYIRNSVPQDPKWKNICHETANEKELGIANKKTDLITLDASEAGDFAHWVTDDCRNYHFVKAIILRHPNQVFSFGIREGFGTQNDALNEHLRIAQIKSRNHNIKKYSSDKSFAQCKENLASIYKAFENIHMKELDINVLILKIQEMQESIKYFREVEIKGLKEQIETQIKEIKDKNEKSPSKIMLPDIIPLDNYWVSEKRVNDDSGSQVYSYYVINKEHLERLKAKNREFYSKKR
jgi:hypothetical protein